MDVVYINRPGDENEELRHSLRSLRNLPHDEVWIAGYCPDWVTGVEKIPVPPQRDKQASALANLIAACQHPEVSDPFIVLNDDMFVMQPLQEVPLWHMGPLDRTIAEHREGSAYRRAMEKTRDRLREQQTAEWRRGLLCYELHIPMVIEKTGMLLALSLGQGIHGLHNRTMYGNLMGLGGVESRDVKVYRGDKGNAYRDWPLLSTSDRTFVYHPVGRYIRSTFPEPSPYERPQRKPRDRAIRYRYGMLHCY